MHRRQRALQPCLRPQLRQRQVWAPGDQGAQALSVFRQQLGLAPAEAVPWGHLARAPTLLQQLLYHPQRNHESLRHFLPGRVALVIAGQDSLP